jgi:hypothetical protein
VLCLMFVLSPSIAFAEWEVRTEHESDGFKCILSTWSIYQESLPTVRDRSVVNLVIDALDPFSFEFELDSGIKSSLRHVGLIKIDKQMFVLEFDGNIGRLKDKTEKQILIEAFRTADKMPAVYGRKGEKNVFDNFSIRGVEEKLPELRSVCSFLG